jgi:hypothetical protein
MTYTRLLSEKKVPRLKRRGNKVQLCLENRYTLVMFGAAWHDAFLHRHITIFPGYPKHYRTPRWEIYTTNFIQQCCNDVALGQTFWSLAADRALVGCLHNILIH